MHHLGQMNYANRHYFLLFLSPFISPLRTHVSSHALSARHLPTLHVQNVKKNFYCSKECRGNDYSFHRRNCRRIARPYVYPQPSRAFEGITFSVSHFMKGPDQPLDPPDTEAYEG